MQTIMMTENSSNVQLFSIVIILRFWFAWLTKYLMFCRKCWQLDCDVLQVGYNGEYHFFALTFTKCYLQDIMLF